MRAARAAAGVAALLVPALSALSCSGFRGELVVAVQTDMSMPKDIDSIQIVVSVLGTVKYDTTFGGLGTESAAIKLPATLALLGPEAIGDPVKIRVTGRRGSITRVTRDVVTTVPEGRIVTLPIKLEGLCADFDVVDRATGIVTNLCAEGETCVGGACVSNELSSDTLADFAEKDIFGGGTGHGDGACFDVTQCFIGAAPLLPTAPGSCTYVAPKTAGEFNVAVLTEITGICGAASCLIALDAGTDSGFTIDGDGHVVLPSGVCDPKLPNTVLGVVVAPVTAECPQKKLGLPTCGAWSSSGPAPSGSNTPALTPVATKQAHPTALAVSDTDVYWANTGVEPSGPKTTPSVKRSAANADALGVISVIDTKGAMPRGLALADKDLLFTASKNGAPDGEIRFVPSAYFTDPTTQISVVQATNAPDGIAVSTTTLMGNTTNRVVWTEFGAGIAQGGTLGANGALTGPFPLGEGLKYPLRIVANDSIACWTEEGGLGGALGSVTCARLDPPTNPPTTWTIADQATPRAVALDSAGSVYWATFEEKTGKIMRATPFAMPAEAPKMLAGDQSYPNGIAIDADRIYWTNWGNGTVWSLPLAGDGDPTPLAEGQERPGAIATNASAIYWINEGSSTEATGSVIRLDKKKK